jgi:hypothetical protein
MELKELKSTIDWVKTSLWATIIILSFFLFKSCEGNKELELTNKNEKEKVKILESESQKYVDVANMYRDSVTILKTEKAKTKIKIVYVTKTVEEKLKVASTLHTKGIANYLQDLYKINVVITQYGVAVPDTMGRAVISDLIRGQGYKAELKFTKELLANEEKSGVAKDSIIVNLDKAVVKKDSASVIKDDIINNVEKSFKKEKNKKTFWKVATGVAVTIATYLAVKP